MSSFVLLGLGGGDLAPAPYGTCHSWEPPDPRAALAVGLARTEVPSLALQELGGQGVSRPHPGPGSIFQGLQETK